MKKVIVKSKNDVESMYFQQEDFVDFAVLTHRNAKRVITLLLRHFSLLIELNNGRMISATYIGYKMLERTDYDIILVFDALKEEEVMIPVDMIKSVRVFG